MIRKLGTCAAGALALSACANGGYGGAMVVGSAVVGSATLAGADGAAHGQAVLRRTGDRLVLDLEASGLAAGLHGAHLHTTGLCEGPGFASAGGHLNPGGRMHGTMNPMGSHLGDLPNLAVEAAGTGRLEVPLAGSADALLAQIFDADGAAVVIHAAPDDQQTGPSGASGARVACGVLRRPA